MSPAVSHDIGWLQVCASSLPTDNQKWFSLIPPETRPDFLAIHVYTTTFESFRQKVEEYYSVFGLPIIVTEFAMTSFDPDVPPPASQQQVHDFMGQTTAWLDATPWIEWVQSCLTDSLTADASRGLEQFGTAGICTVCIPSIG